jgi:hypothetical protein
MLLVACQQDIIMDVGTHVLVNMFIWDQLK